MAETVFTLLWVTPLGLLAGFATQRGSLCAVAAVGDVLGRQQWGRFVGFLQCSGWALVLLWLANLAGFSAPAPSVGLMVPRGLPIWLLPVLGGALFGIGAWLNGGCVFGTFARLGSGEISFLLTLAAIAGGYSLFRFGFADQLGLVTNKDVNNDWLRWPIRMGLGLLFLLNIIALWRLRIWHVAVWRKSVWSPALSVFIFALCDIGLVISTNTWPGVPALLSVWRAGESTIAASLIVPLLLAGAIFGAISGGRFILRSGVYMDLWKRLGGGLLMGFGAALVPGGNQQMLMSHLPMGQWQGILAYITMILVLLVVMSFARRSSPLA